MSSPNNSIELNKIYNIDCFEFMDKLIEQGIVVDAIITDPPYGTTACKWDIVIPFNEMWKRLNKLIKPSGAIVLFGSEPFSSLLRVSNIEMYKYDWKWEKPSGANFLNFKYQPSKVHEDILVFGKMATSYSKNGNMTYLPQMEIGMPYTQKSGKQKTKNANTSVRSEIKQVITKNNGDRYPKSVQKFKLDKDKFHPTQKPVELIEYLIKTYTNEGEVILDFTTGSGTTAVACKNTNRNFYACELDSKYVEISNKRLSQVQGSLF